MAYLVSLQGEYGSGILSLIHNKNKNAGEGVMQEYYNKKAKECEAAVVQLEQQIERMNTNDAESLKAQMDRVRREMRNYKAALSPAVS
jgi:molecular chaperone GrpE (heat shock protein)